MSAKFSHHHVHTEYSPQDAPVPVKKLVKLSKEKGFKTVTITDHGTLSGWVKLATLCKEEKLKPIFGIEAYFVPDRLMKKGGQDNRHLVLIAKTNEGIRNIYRMSEMSYRDGFYYNPRVDWDLLQKHHEGVICLSACVMGIVPHAFMTEGYEAAAAHAKKFQGIFGDDFYLELQFHGLEFEAKAYGGVAKIAHDLGIKTVATNDVHYLRKEDVSVQEILMAINMDKRLRDPNRIRHDTNQLYLKTAEEMVEVFGGQNKMPILSTLEIAEKCTAQMEFGKTQLPIVKVPPTYKSDMEYLESLARDGMRRIKKEGDPVYEARFKEEMDVLKEIVNKGLRFDRYFLCVWDYVNWAWNNGIRVGIGRGSGAGSLLLYCLRITGIDPIPYDLLFERFLTPDRNEMPDIDIDFDSERGNDVFNYICEKYGADRCARIGTSNVFHVAAALKAAFRAFDPCNTFEKEQQAKEYTNQQRKTSKTKAKRWDNKEQLRDETKALADEINKKLPKDLNGRPSSKCTLLKEVYDKNPNEMIYVYDEIPEFRDLKLQYPEVFDFAEKIEGLVNERGIHAAGAIITADPLVDICPQQYSGEAKNMATAYDMIDVEKVGGIKVDLLRTAVLSVITRTLKMVKDRHGIDIDIDNLPPTDPKVLKTFQDGNTIAIFQFESDGMRNMLKKMKPDCFEEIIAANALYRPGPLAYVDDFCARKSGKRAVTYPVASLEQVLKPTFGIMVYQEQVMKITRILAGFSGSQADKVRKAMGKKKKEILDEMSEKFFKGCGNTNSCHEGTAKELWGQMETFAQYAFNKSHSCAYAYTAYQSAYLMTYYPAEFMAAQLTVEGGAGHFDTVKWYEEHTRSMGIKLFSADVNKSKGDYVVGDAHGKPAVRRGFKGMKGLGGQVAVDIMAGQPYRDMYDYCFRANSGAQSNVVTSLIDEGAFNSFLPKLSEKLCRQATRADLEAEYNDKSKQAQTEKKEKGARKEEKEGIGFIFAIDRDKKASEADLKM